MTTKALNVPYIFDHTDAIDCSLDPPPLWMPGLTLAGGPVVRGGAPGNREGCISRWFRERKVTKCCRRLWCILLVVTNTVDVVSAFVI